METPGPAARASKPVGLAPLATLLVLHGLFHVTGFLLLWDVAEPANLTYAETSPDPGSAAGRLVGVGWLLAGALFVFAAVLLYRRHAERWSALLAATVLSLAVLLPSQDGVSVGITADLVVIVCVVKAFARRERTPAPTR